MSPFVIPSVFTAIDKFSAPMKQMGNAVNGFVGRSERLLGRANVAFSRLMAPISNLNRMLNGLGFYIGFYSLIRVLKSAIDVYADFEQANANLAIVMGVTVSSNKALALEARRIGLAYGVSATEVVKMQHALATLGFEQADIMKMGRPLITGSSALEGANPERLADIVGAMINTFDSLDSGHTQHILDVMALGANRTALTFEKLATTLPIVAGPANAVGISFERVVALLGVLSNAGVHVATSATSLKNIFIDSAKKGHTYEQVLDNIAKNSDKLTFANAKFGKRSVVSALVLAAKMNEAKNGVKDLTTEFENAEIGLTALIAKDRLNTFRGAQKLLNASYNEFVLSIEDGNGPLATSLRNLLLGAAAMLQLASGGETARSVYSRFSTDIVLSAQKWIVWIKVVGYAIATLLALRTALWVWRGLLIAVTILQGAWSIALGISAAVGWTNVFALRGNAIALGALRVVMWLSTAAQWALNVAMSANPVVLITLGILALVAAYNELTSSVDSATAAEDKFAKSREGKDPLGTFMHKVNRTMDRFIGDTYYLDKEKEKDSVNTVEPKINPKAVNAMNLDSLANMILNGRLKIDLNDPAGMVKQMKSDSSWISPKVSTTNGW